MTVVGGLPFMLHYSQLYAGMNLIFFFILWPEKPLNMNKKKCLFSSVTSRRLSVHNRSIQQLVAAFADTHETENPNICYEIFSIVFPSPFQVPWHQVAACANKRKKEQQEMDWRFIVLCGIREHKICLLHSPQLFSLLIVLLLFVKQIFPLSTLERFFM